MSQFLDDLLASSERRMASFRTRAAEMVEMGGSGNPITAAAGGSMSTLTFGQQLTRASEQYKHYVGWPYVAINRVASRLAGMPIRMGRKTQAGVDALIADRQSRWLGPLGLAKAPLHVQQKAKLVRRKEGPSTDVEIIESHPLLTAIENPNVAMTQASLMHVTAASLELVGMCHWWLTGTAQQPEIWPLPSDWVTPVHSETELFVAWKVKPSGSVKEYVLPKEAIAYFPLPDPSNPVGTVSPTGTQSPAIAVDEQIQVSQFRTFKNGLFPGVMLKTGRLPGMMPGQPGERPVLTPEQRKEIVQAARAVWEGAVNYNEPLILDGMIEGVERISNIPSEMGYLESGKSVKSRIFQAYGVNPVVAGEIESVNRAQAAVAESIFLENVINPLADLIGQVMTAKLGDPSLLFWLETARVKDDEMRLKEWSVGFKYKAVKRNEYRCDVLGLPPVDEWDEADEGGAGGGGSQTPPKPPPEQDGGGDGSGGGGSEPSGNGDSGDQGGNPGEGEDGERQAAMKTAGQFQIIRQDPADHRRRKIIVEKLHLKQLDGLEAEMEAAMHGFFRMIARKVVPEVRKLARQAPGLFTGRTAGRAVAEMVFQPREWDEALREAAGVPLLHAVSSGYLTERALLEQRVQQGSKAAPDWDVLLMNWEIPPDVAAKAKGEVERSMSQPHWDKVNDTTRAGIERRVQEAVDKGFSLGTLSKNIAGELGDDKRKRSMLIARTEMTGAMNSGHQLQMGQMEQAGLAMLKTWTTVGDIDVRDTHVSMNGIVVRGTDGVFIVGGVPVPYPGHYLLPPEERCNCRCSVYTDVEADAPSSVQQALAAQDAAGGYAGDIGGVGAGYDYGADQGAQNIIGERSMRQLQSSEFEKVTANGEDTLKQYQTDPELTPDEMMEKGNWDKIAPGRKALHDEIIADSLKKGAAADKPTVYYMGGGPASGKSSVVKSGRVKLPKRSVLVDPDAIKGQLPEYKELVAIGDKTAAAIAHEESSMLSKRLLDAAQEKRSHVVMDSCGDGGYAKLKKKLTEARGSGHRVVGNYVTVDTEAAVSRAVKRAEKSGREVPKAYIRETHAKISEVLPKTVDEGLFDELRVWDNNVPKGKPPVLIFEYKDGKKTIHDQALWDRFLSKAKGG